MGGSTVPTESLKPFASTEAEHASETVSTETVVEASADEGVPGGVSDEAEASEAQAN